VRDVISVGSRSAYCSAGPGLPQPEDCLGDTPPGRRYRNSTVTPVPLATLAWRPWQEGAEQAWTEQEFVLSHGRGVRNSGGYVSYRLLQAETNDSTQLGWNASWLDQRLTTRFAAFHTRVRDRYQGTTDQVGARGQMHGLELELEARLSPRWRLNLGLGRQQGDYSVYQYDNEHPDAAVAGLPLHTTLAGLHYGLDTGWYATLNYYRTSPADTSPGSGSLYRRDGYDLADLRAGLRRDDWELACIITNLLDRSYLDRVDLRSYTRLSEPRFRLGDPRRVELRWEYQWR
jgi:outer membrane receptor protein involved in Fe transport